MFREAQLARKGNQFHPQDAFAVADEFYAAFKEKLESPDAWQMEHSEVEKVIQTYGRELMRRLFQAHLGLRAHTEGDAREVGPVVGVDGVERRHRRSTTQRENTSIFGKVTVNRAGYNAPGSSSLFPLDAELNLPDDSFSHGMREHVAREVAKNSYEEAVETISRMTGVELGKRQAEQLAGKAARDFEEFYATREEVARSEQEATGELMVLSVDGKGIAMRPEGLREKTRKEAEKWMKEPGPPKKQLKRNKRHTKRIATVGAVYTVKPYVRTPEDIMHNLQGVTDVSEKRRRPRPEHKRVWASITARPEEVVADAFDEGVRRDPEGKKRWVALVDGNESQLDALERQARKRNLVLTIILDIIHVIGRLWEAARVLSGQSKGERQQWVVERVLNILRGKCTDIAAGMRRSATLRGISQRERKPVDLCADYLLKYQDYLRYDEYLAAGLPIATGVIEGACRHVVEDRMGITGARWSLDGAEAVLRLRALHASGDFDDYWRFHLEQERQLNHVMLYEGEPPPVHCSPALKPTKYPHLRLVL